MKKTMLSLAALLTFSIATAQADPVEPPQTTPEPTVTKVNNGAKNHADTDVDVPIDPKTVEETKYSVVNDGDARKDELTTKGHVKSTPAPSIINDKKDVPATTNKKKRKKQNR